MAVKRCKVSRWLMNLYRKTGWFWLEKLADCKLLRRYSYYLYNRRYCK